jgi:hypothetical protein
MLLRVFVRLIIFTYVYGVGYDDLINDYEVFLYVHIIGEHVGYKCISLEEFRDKYLHPFWEIYSLSNDSLKKLDVDTPSYINRKEGSQVHMNGVCHYERV